MSTLQRIDPRSITTAYQLYEAGDIGRCELIHGELKLMSPVTAWHGIVVTRIATRLDVYVEAKGLGFVMSGDPGYELAEDTVFGPDVAFLSAERAVEIPLRGWFRGVPDLAVEVLSPDDRPGEVAAKIADWLAAACRAVWKVDPRTKTASVHRAGQAAVTLGRGDVLSGEEVVPGFMLRLDEVFAGLPERMP